MSRSIAAVLFLAVLAAPAAGLELRLQASGGVATDLPPGTTAAWLWVDHRLGDYAPLITHGTEITPDADADGQVELDGARGVSPLVGVGRGRVLTTG
ncbi:MAG: hypothetical protein HC897_20280, partial [Thermoanaerobaculia bacterium]|nr:hypothetical protein [Thermoanaerobaculia bacterium]